MLKMDIPGLFVNYCLPFQMSIQFHNKLKPKISKNPSMLCWDSNSQPLVHESPLKTTRTFRVAMLLEQLLLTPKI